MIRNKAKFYGGFGLLVSFFVILGIIFSPLFTDGQNGLEYLDNLYNSISKGSAYYIPALREEVTFYAGNTVTVSLPFEQEEQAQQTALLFERSGATVTRSGRSGRIVTFPAGPPPAHRA